MDQPPSPVGEAGWAPWCQEVPTGTGGGGAEAVGHAGQETTAHKDCQKLTARRRWPSATGIRAAAGQAEHTLYLPEGRLKVCEMSE